MKAKRKAPQAQRRNEGTAGDAALAPENGAPRAVEPIERAGGPLCVVGVGASAGGVEALSALLSHLPPASGMAFVVVPHLATERPSVLAEILARTTTMPVVEATRGARVAADRVYVIPPGALVTYVDGRLELHDRPAAPPHVPIDVFLRSLAMEQRNRAIGVILSGTGSDGALGVQAIKGEGGITFAQDARSAKFDGMPLSAVSTGCVDFMLPPEQIAKRLGEIAARLRAVLAEPPSPTPATVDDASLARILAILRAAHDVDFTLYRHTTIRRRIARRMVLARTPQVADYVDLLETRPLEVEALHQDILIKVTYFFRDADAFEAMKRHVFPALLRGRAGDAPVRMWVPGCASGEEVYSLAIAFVEVASELHPDAPFQIFATDVSEEALEKARAGVYLENIAMDVAPERLRRFFVRTGKHFQISKSIRDACVFARQDVTRDPPFSKLDLISCRNVLIYFEPALQKRVVPVFHYALRPTGFLVLGASEAVGGPTPHFTLVDKKNKIYAKSPELARPSLDLGGGLEPAAPARAEKPAARAGEGARPLDVQSEADRVVMSRYAPPGVVVNADLQIVQFRGHTGPYFEPAPGEASLNVLKMAREGLAMELRAALHKAKRAGTPVRAPRVPLRVEGARREVTIEVIPIAGAPRADDGAPDRWFLVLFEEHGEAAGKPRAPKSKAKGAADSRSAKLERELAATKEYLQLTIEEHEAAHEELAAANEELLSSNEELQSINEELTTAKEELQSTNEELTTLNEELESRNAELARLNNDLVNLLASVNIPIVMLSADHRIRRFTPQAERVLDLIPSDVGRPISDIKPKLDVPDLEQLVAEVIESVSIRELEVQDREGRWYSMRIRPYRTMDNKIDGAVIILVDVDRLKRTVAAEAAPHAPHHAEPAARAASD